MTRPSPGILGLLAVALLAGCGSLLGDPDRVIGLEVVGSTNRKISVGDTLILLARGVTARGERVASLQIEWAVLDSVVTAFSLDPATGMVIGKEKGSGRVQGRYQELRTDPITITVESRSPD